MVDRIKTYIVIIFLFFTCFIYSQNIEIIPQTPTSSDTLIIYCWGSTPNLVSSIQKLIIKKGNTFTISIRIIQSFLTTVGGWSTKDTVGLLPPGNYRVFLNYQLCQYDWDGNLICNEQQSLKNFSVIEFTPVEFTIYSSKIIKNKIELFWQTATETDNKGFQIERKLNGEWQDIGFVKGAGTSTERNNYSFKDDFKNNFSGFLFYRLKQIDFNGTFSYSKVIKLKVDFSVKEFSLSQNYPNPFNPTTTIHYEIPKSSFVELKVYNTLGQLEKNLVNENKQAGRYDVIFKGDNIPSGIYFYHIQAGEYSDTKKFVLLK